MKIGKIAPVLLLYGLIVGIFVGATYLGSEATSAVAQMIPLERTHTIVIDAGHGGQDGGAVSCSGVPESTINLEIALKLNDLFRFLGYDTVMVRTTPDAIDTEGNTIASRKVSDTKNRVALVNGTENALLVSIHQNTFPDSRYSGAQVFYGREGPSKELAEALQAAFSRTVNTANNRQCKKAEGVYLMEHINRPGILVECGFLSNFEEEARLRDPGYQKMLCCVIAATVGNFLDG